MKEQIRRNIEECEQYLKALPNDIKNIKELENIIGNDEHMSRAYDLGRLEALKEILNNLK